jgi:hypothetical protein
MNGSFVPKLLTPPMNQDDRELGLLVYHLYVGEEDKLGTPPPQSIVDAGVVSLSPAPATAAAGTAVPAKVPAGGAAAPTSGTEPTKQPAAKKS